MESVKFLSLAGLQSYDAKLKTYIGALLTDANGDIAAVEALVNTLIGTEKNEDNSLKDAGKSVRTIANEELAAQLLSGKADADFKTLQELAAWLEDHPEEAAAINLDLQNIHAEIGVKAEAAAEGKDAVAATGIYKYVDDAVSGKNVDAEGDDVYVAATAANNKVSVSATYGTLTAALAQDESSNKLGGTCTSSNGIAKAEDVQALVAANEGVITAAYNDHEDRIVTLEGYFDGEEGTVADQIEAAKQEVLDVIGDGFAANGEGETGNTVSEQLAAVKTTADSALQTIGKGEDGDYVTTTVSTKADNNSNVSVALTIQGVATAGETAMGVAEASDVKTYVDGEFAKITAIEETEITALFEEEEEDKNA